MTIFKPRQYFCKHAMNTLKRLHFKIPSKIKSVVY